MNINCVLYCIVFFYGVDYQLYSIIIYIKKNNNFQFLLKFDRKKKLFSKKSFEFRYIL